MPKYKKTNIVCLVSDTLQMTITKVHGLPKSVKENKITVFTGKYTCTWHDKEGKLQTAIFKEEELVLV